MAEPASPLPPRMTADEFIEWSRRQPEGMHYELSDGVTVRMAAERSEHALTKLDIAVALRLGVRSSGVDCTVFGDGMAVRIDETTVYEPDAFVHCGQRIERGIVEMTDAVIAVEVLSPSTQGRDFEQKLRDYFRLPSLRHYLIVNPDTGRVVHHRRDETSGKIETKIVADGVLALDPPGIEVEVADFFASLPPEQTAEPEADS
jgi:Uma2 family endonuclease